MDRNDFVNGVLAVVIQRMRAFDTRLSALVRESGPPGPPGPAPEHRWRGSKLSIQHPDGRWGREVELRGPSGGVTVVGGSASAPIPERVQHTDYADTRYAYVGFVSRIARIDYSVSPPLKQTADSGDWDNRTSLTYI